MENNKDFFEVLHVLYVKGLSEGLQRKLRRLRIGLVPRREETLHANLCRFYLKTESRVCRMQGCDTLFHAKNVG